MDRNGVVIATNIPTTSLYIDSTKMKNPENIAVQLSSTFGNLVNTKICIKYSLQKGNFPGYKKTSDSKGAADNKKYWCAWGKFS